MGARTRSEAAAGGAGLPELPGARLAANQLRRMRRVVDAAVRLAEKGGFEGVRLRDVAEHSGVALGTLYKYFHSKEDILLFALNEELERVEQALAERPASGRTPLARVTDFFRRATEAFLGNPQLGRAVLRAMAGGDAETAVRIAGAQLRVARLVVAALHGETPDLAAAREAELGDERERRIALTLQYVWFAALVGWSVGIHPESAVIHHVRTAAELILKR